VFSDADEAEYFGAGMRLASAGHKAYSQRARDLEIIGQKAGSTLDNTYAGVLVVHETAPQIIDLLHTFGATRQLVPVTPMRDGEMRVNRKTANMAFGFEGESEEIPETNPTLDQVRLVANKLAGIGRVSNELLDDSAFDIADLVATSSAAGLSKAEDDAYFFGTGLANFTGLAGKIDTPSTYDAALASNWGDVTVDQIEEWIGLVPIEAWRSGTVKIACSHRFFRTVLNRFAVGAGGNTGEQILGGFGPATQYGGIPVVLTEVLPSTYVADQKAAYIGSFERGTKMGVVTGSEQIDASDQAYWKFDQYAWRVKERIAFNIHDVGGADSEVIAFQS
jgi:HK97 family phage major capsid protein